MVLVQPFPLTPLKRLMIPPLLEVVSNMTPWVSVLVPALVLWLLTARWSTASRVVLYAPPVAVSSGWCH